MQDNPDDRELPPIDSYLDDITAPAQDTAPDPTKKAAAKGYTSLNCRILHETAKALLVSIDGIGGQQWIPLSQIGYIYRPCGFIDLNQDYTDIIHVADWFVNKYNLEG